MKCNKCGYDWSNSGDSAHVCGPVIDRAAAIRIATALGWSPKREWVGLTDEEVKDLMDVVDHYNFPEDLITYTQAKLKEKNT